MLPFKSAHGDSEVWLLPISLRLVGARAQKIRVEAKPRPFFRGFLAPEIPMTTRLALVVDNCQNLIAFIWIHPSKIPGIEVLVYRCWFRGLIPRPADKPPCSLNLVLAATAAVHSSLESTRLSFHCRATSAEFPSFTRPSRYSAFFGVRLLTCQWQSRSMLCTISDTLSIASKVHSPSTSCCLNHLRLVDVAVTRKSVTQGVFLKRRWMHLRFQILDNPLGNCADVCGTIFANSSLKCVARTSMA